MSVDRGARSLSVKTSAKKRPMDYDKQRREAIKRDGLLCVAIRGRKPCGAVAHATLHVYRRWLCGPAADHVDVVIRGCVPCHDQLDGRTENVDRVSFPLAARRRAWDRIVSVSKDTKTIGPRP
jgi:hypothetical protein